MKNRPSIFLNCSMLFAFLLPILISDVSRAEPYITMRTGFKCSQCHVNRSGGGKRTPFGVFYSQVRLPSIFYKTAQKSNPFNHMLNDNISFGANFRVDNRIIFATENSSGEKSSTRNGNRISEGNLYIEMNIVKNFLTFYIDQTIAPIAGNREAFGLINNLPLNSYIKVGKMLLPFGLRLLDDDAFIRDKTGFTYNQQDIGFEFGLEPGSLSLITAITDRQLSMVGSTVFRRFRVGMSYARNTEMANDFVYGVFGGLNSGKFTLLGEVDFIRKGFIDQRAYFAELNFLMSKGINLKGTYNYFDRNTAVSIARNGQERITLGVETFPTQFLQVSLFYRINRFVPQNVPLNEDQLTFQFHLFF